MTEAEAQTALYAWAHAVLPAVAVIHADQAPAPRPGTPFVQLRMMVVRPQGQDEVLPVVVDGYGFKQPRRLPVALVVSAQAFGSGAFDNLAALAFSGSKSGIREALHTAGLTFQGPQGPVSLVPLAGHEHRQPRAVADFQFGACLEDDGAATSIIEHIEGTATYKNEAGETVLVDNVEIDLT